MNCKWMLQIHNRLVTLHISNAICQKDSSEFWRKIYRRIIYCGKIHVWRFYLKLYIVYNKELPQFTKFYYCIFMVYYFFCELWYFTHGLQLIISVITLNFNTFNCRPRLSFVSLRFFFLNFSRVRETSIFACLIFLKKYLYIKF